MPRPKKSATTPAIPSYLKSDFFSISSPIGRLIRDTERPLRFLEQQTRIIEEAQKRLPLGRLNFDIFSSSPMGGNLIGSMMRDYEERLKLFKKQYGPVLSNVGIGSSLSRYLESIAKPSEEFRSLLNSLELSYQNLGEIPIDYDPKDTEKTTDLKDEIGKEATSRLIRVDCLPVHLIQAIIKDPSLLLQTSSREFEERMAALLEKLGFKDVYLTQASKDKGVDIWASQTINEIPLLFAFDCKQWAPNRKIGYADMKVMLETVESSTPKPDKGMILTTSTFTKGAWSLTAQQTNLWGRDLAGIIKWMKTVKTCVRDELH